MTDMMDFNQIPINFSFYTKKTLDNFIVGENQILIDALRKLNTENHIYLIYGKKASGKTHLCNAIKSMNLSNSFYVNEEKYIENKKIDSVYDILIIDDLDKIIDKSDVEEYLFSIINNQIINNKSVVITSTEDIESLNIKLPDLKSRIISEFIFEIKDLDDNQKINLMTNVCKERGFDISMNVIRYILNNYNRDLYFLYSLIKNIDSASLSSKKKITIPFIKKVLNLLNG